jgi:uncharacterized C2H2 Zn-finger protein
MIVICDKCGEYFSGIGHLNRHMQSCHWNITYKCELCKQTFNRKDSLRRHIKKIHGKIFYDKL